MDNIVYTAFVLYHIYIGIAYCKSRFQSYIPKTQKPESCLCGLWFLCTCNLNHSYMKWGAAIRRRKKLHKQPPDIYKKAVCI